MYCTCECVCACVMQVTCIISMVADINSECALCVLSVFVQVCVM